PCSTAPVWLRYNLLLLFFFFQAEDGIRDFHVTGVQTCALPISFFSILRFSIKSLIISSEVGGSGSSPYATSLSDSTQFILLAVSPLWLLWASSIMMANFFACKAPISSMMNGNF